MKNYLIYIRMPKGRQTSEGLSIPDQIEMMEEYARVNDWNVVGFVFHRDEPAESTKEAKAMNLRRYLEKHNDVDVVVATVTQPLNSADYSAMKTILDQKRVKHTVITISREDDDESTDASPDI